jgi:pimeloyl-ACP methyl ester carboxylesterase
MVWPHTNVTCATARRLEEFVSLLARPRVVVPAVGVLAGALLFAGNSSAADPVEAAAEPGYTQTFVPLGGSQVNGVLYEQTAPGPNAAVGLVLAHPNNNFQNSLACHELAERGFTALCFTTRYNNTNRETMVWEDLALDVAPAVQHLRDREGIDSVVLVGHSGGGQLMPFYQNVAENGADVCQARARIVKCDDELDGLPPADGVVLLDAHHGYGANTLTSLDGALVNERKPDAVRSSVDMYDPRNGYDEDGSEYSGRFVDRYLDAQAARSARLLKAAQKAVADVAAGRGQFPDAEQFSVYRTDARIWQCDVRLVSHTKGKYPVLHPGGTATTEVARTVRVPSCDPESNASFDGGAVQYTAEAYLSSQTIRTTKHYDITDDDIEGVVWESSNTSTPENIKGVTVPTLIMAMTGHYWMVSSEMFYERSGADDKSLVFVEGASHGFTPCTACEDTPGEFGDTVATTFDHLAGWLAERYVA